MYRIFIVCALAIQVQSRPFAFLFGGRATPIFNPWPLPSPSPQPPGVGILDTYRMHQSAYFPFIDFLRQSPPPPRFYGRVESQSPLPYQVFGPSSTAPTFIPSNGFNAGGQQNYQQNGFGPSNNQFPVNNGPQFSSAQYSGVPAAVYGPPSQTFGAPPSIAFSPPNGLFSRFDPSNPNYNLPSQNTFQLPPVGLPVAPFATSVLPLIPHISSAGTTYLPPATVNQKDSTQKVDTSPFTTPMTFDSETNANELSTQTESTKVPSVIRDGIQTTQDEKEASVSSTASEASTTESSATSSSPLPLSTTLQTSEFSSEISSTTLGSTDTGSTDASETAANNSKTTTTELSSTESSSTESSPTESSSTESSTDDESNAV